MTGFHFDKSAYRTSGRADYSCVVAQRLPIRENWCSLSALIDCQESRHIEKLEDAKILNGGFRLDVATTP